MKHRKSDNRDGKGGLHLRQALEEIQAKGESIIWVGNGELVDKGAGRTRTLLNVKTTIPDYLATLDGDGPPVRVDLEGIGDCPIYEVWKMAPRNFGTTKDLGNLLVRAFMKVNPAAAAPEATDAPEAPVEE
jgi:hypothetical protein